MDIFNKIKNTVKVSMLKTQKGFTLVELLIVISLISVMSAIALPGLVSSINHYKFQSGVSDLTGVFNWAHLSSVTKNTYIKVNVVIVNEGTAGLSSYSVTSYDKTTGTWLPYEGKTNEGLPRNLNLLDPLGGFELAFRPDGSVVRSDAVGVGTALPAGYALNFPAINACFSNSKDTGDSMRVAIDTFTGRMVIIGKCT